jgi:aryl-alcohol dehydrogenase-like predicted oxidoreductase
VIPRRPLAPDYAVPRLIIGGWQHAAGHSAQRLEPTPLFAVWDALHDRGADTFDCADIYTGVEALIGRYLAARRARGLPRSFVHTKFVPDLSVLPTIDRGYVGRIVDRSLARLGVETLDLVQFHWWDYGVPGAVETLGWLDDLRRAGKVRHLGLTNFDVLRLDLLLETGIPIRSIQAQYSLIDRRPEHRMLARCAERSIGLLAYGTLAGGFFSERWLGAMEPAAMSNRSLVKYRLIIEEAGGWAAFQALLAAVAGIAAKHETGIGAVAMRAMLDRPGVTAAIVGIRGEDTAAAVEQPFALVLDDDDRDRLEAADRLLRSVPGDVYSLERVRDGPHGRIMRYDANAE